MQLTEYKPILEVLRSHVDRYSLLEIISHSQIDSWEKCIPDGFIKIFFFETRIKGMYADEKGKLHNWQDGVGGHPLNQNSFIRLPAGTNRFFFANLKPSFFYQIFKIPISELNDSVTSLQELSCKEGVELNEKIWTSPDRISMIRHLDNFFARKLLQNTNSPSKMEHVQNCIFSSKGNIDIGHIAKAQNINIRTLQRRFQEEIGVSPKHFARIARFNHALNLIRSNSTQNKWQDIVNDCGYYDQSHFIHDVRSVTGESPKVYFSELCNITDLHAGR